MIVAVFYFIFVLSVSSSTIFHQGSLISSMVQSMFSNFIFCVWQGQYAYPNIDPYYGSLYAAYGGQPLVSFYTLSPLANTSIVIQFNFLQILGCFHFVEHLLFT